MAAVSFDEVTKQFGSSTVAVDRLTLDVNEGEFLILVGPSGCGKTTALRMVAGLEQVTSGEIAIDGRVVNDVVPTERDIAMVFQNYALYPHMSVFDNIAFPLRQQKVKKAAVRERVAEAARLLNIEELLERKPRELSGGQRQRVAIGRALVRRPKAFLMDEPLSNLDAKLRVQMRAEIARIQRDLQVTTIYVTHDQSEAMTLGDRVCVLSRGVLQQVDRPQVLYERPVNLFVAGFIGSPAMNLVDAELVERDGGLAVAFGPHELDVPGSLSAGRPRLKDHVGRHVALGIRPEDIAGVAGSDVPAGSRLDVTVDIREDMGSEVFLHFAIDAPPVVTEALMEVVGGEALAAADVQTHHRGSPFVARVPRGTAAREGEPARLVVETERLHFFDLATGEAL
jgi:multiple sugar transport system ATP-binding protein